MELQKPRPKLKKYLYYIFAENIFFAYNIFNASSSFSQKCINFVEQRLEFSHFEGSIIP